MIPTSGNGFWKRSCSNNKVERDDDSKKSHPALECRRRVDPDGAHPGLSRVAILVGQIGRKVEGISRIEQVDLAVDRQLKLTFHHIADLLALVLKNAGRRPAWLYDHHKACEQPAIRIRDYD